MNQQNTFHRRQLLQTGVGAGALALSTMVHAEASTRGELVPHFAPTAKSVIYLFMAGGPSQVDTFDPKPELAKLAGKDVPETIAKQVPKIKRAGLQNLMASHWKFSQHGQSGLSISSLLPNIARHADELCVIRSMNHRNPVHGPGECVAFTGTGAGDRPSIGAWTLYGLGAENNNLPAFITMNLHTDGMQFPQVAGWSSGFLPPKYQATVVDPYRGIRNVTLPKGTTDESRRKQLDLIKWFNQQQLESLGRHEEMQARIRTYSLAFKMQTSAPELFDISSETQSTRTLFGLDVASSKSVGHGCLLARRMVERGVRFVQLRVGGWDAHGKIKENHEKLASRTDQPIAALLTDLKRRGLLESTLVVWGGEFGRTPTMEGSGKGRDHSPAGYSVWMAGGGVKGGQVIGKTDPLGYVAIDRPVSPHDFHATILHALGLDANQLSYVHHGRKEVPTVFGGAAIREVFS